MLYNVAQLMKASVGTSLGYDIQEEEIQLDEDLKVIGPIDGHVRIRRTNQGLLVDGWVDLTLELTCTRCLNIFEQSMHVTFMEQFHPTVDIVTGLALPPIEEEEASYGSTTKTTNFTGAPGRAASTSSPDTTTTGCLSEL